MGPHATDLDGHPRGHRTAVAACTAGGGDNDHSPTRAEPTRSQKAPNGVPIPETVFARDDFVWRSTKVGSGDTYAWSDGSGAGRYLVQIACLGGDHTTMTARQGEHGPATSVRCDGTVKDVIVCNKERKRSITFASWHGRPRWDAAWQLVKLGDTCKELDTGQA